MTEAREEAPIFICAYDLHTWLLDRLAEAGKYAEVRAAVLASSRSLLENVSLALAGHATRAHVADADEDLVLLRVHLRLAAEKDLLDNRRLLYASRQLRDIGRQIGGWRKRLEALN